MPRLKTVCQFVAEVMDYIQCIAALGIVVWMIYMIHLFTSNNYVR